MKSLSMLPSICQKAAVWVTSVRWLTQNLKQNSSRSWMTKERAQIVSCCFILDRWSSKMVWFFFTCYLDSVQVPVTLKLTFLRSTLLCQLQLQMSEELLVVQVFMTAKFYSMLQTLRLNFSRLQLSHLAAPVNTMFWSPTLCQAGDQNMVKHFHPGFSQLCENLLDVFAQWDSCWYFGGNWVFDFVLRIEVSELCLLLAQHQSAAINQINLSTKQQTKPECKCLTMTQEFIKHKFIFGFIIASRCV